MTSFPVPVGALLSTMKINKKNKTEDSEAALFVPFKHKIYIFRKYLKQADLQI